MAYQLRIERLGYENGDSWGFQKLKVDATQEKIQVGFLGAESTRDSSGFGITVSYWASEPAIRAWKANIEHLAAQEQGRSSWYCSTTG